MIAVTELIRKEKYDRKDKTRQKFLEAIKECMKEKSVDNISVRMITEKSGMTRQTFYRYFLDKYDLINWYFDTLLLASFDRMGSGNTILEGLERKFRFIEEEKAFFIQAFRSDDQNSLKEHDFQLILEFYCNLIKEKTGREPEGDIRFYLEMYCRGSVFMTISWMFDGFRTDPERLAELMIKAMPEELVKLFEKLGVLK